MVQRNHGLDGLRILSMFMVVVLHVLGVGGVLDQTPPLSVRYWAAWGLEIACYCAVNCFVLISGCVLSSSRFRSARLIELWLQTVFYSFGISLLFFLLRPGTLSPTALLQSLTPVTHSVYWYVTAYFGLYLLSPLLRAAVQTVDRASFRFTLWAVFAAFSLLPTLLLQDPYRLGGGYSTLWLCLLFCLGAYLRPSGQTRQVPRLGGWLLFLGSVALTLGVKVLCETAPSSHPLLASRSSALISYISPTMVAAAVGLFWAMSGQTFPRLLRRIIGTLSPAALGVYLIHVCPPVWNHLLSGAFSSLAHHSTPLLVLLVLAAALTIYLVCSAIELLRIRLFRLLGLSALCQRAGDWLDRRFCLSP